MIFELARGIGDGIKVVKLIFLCQNGSRPPAMSAVPVAASVISAYCLSARGKAITGSDTRDFFRMQKASMASFGNGPPL